MVNIQTKGAYQKQLTIFQNKKRVLLGETGKEKLPRDYKNTGLGFKTKMKMRRTIVIHRDYLYYIRKYNRFEKCHKNVSAHLSPCFRDVQIGDIVMVGECRPLSKTEHLNVLEVSQASSTKKQFQKF